MPGKSIAPDVTQLVYYNYAIGKSVKEISQMFSLTLRTVYNIIKRAKSENRIKHKPRSGRPRKISARLIHILKAKIEKNPKISTRALSNELKQEYCIEVSHETIRQTLFGIKSELKSVHQNNSSKISSTMQLSSLTNIEKKEDTTNCKDESALFENRTKRRCGVKSGSKLFNMHSSPRTYVPKEDGCTDNENEKDLCRIECRSTIREQEYYSTSRSSESLSSDIPMQSDICDTKEEVSTGSESEASLFKNATKRKNTINGCKFRSMPINSELFNSDAPASYKTKKEASIGNENEADSYENETKCQSTVSHRECYSPASSSDSLRSEKPMQLLFDTCVGKEEVCTDSETEASSFTNRTMRQSTAYHCKSRSRSSSVDPLSFSMPVDVLFHASNRKRNKNAKTKRDSLLFENNAKRQHSIAHNSMKTPDPLSPEKLNSFLLETSIENSNDKKIRKRDVSSLIKTVKRQRVSQSPALDILWSNAEVWSPDKKPNRCYACGQVMPERSSQRVIKSPLKYLRT